jgi:SagB-type dehydrogenase family enzyme
MHSKTIDRIRRASRVQSDLWELFHENSKVGRLSTSVPNDLVVAWMDIFTESLEYSQHPKIPLPERAKALTGSLQEAIVQRVSVREFSSEPVAFEDMAALLHYSYGVNRPKSDQQGARSFRNCPSGGGLFPLDVYFYAHAVELLENGVYHYDPIGNCLRMILEGDFSHVWSGVLVQPEFGKAGMVVFIAAQFERSLFKYQDRGYRFVLLEAGHLAQNLNLVATSLALGCVPIGGYFDREADRLLGLDGLMNSTVYMLAVGHRATQP